MFVSNKEFSRVCDIALRSLSRVQELESRIDRLESRCAVLEREILVLAPGAMCIGTASLSSAYLKDKVELLLNHLHLKYVIPRTNISSLEPIYNTTKSKG